MTPMLEKATRAVHDVPRERGDAFDVGDVMAANIVRAVLLAIGELDGFDSETKLRFDFVIDTILGEKPA